MVEEGQATATDTTADETSAATTDVPESFINTDGTLAEGWRDKYVPEDLRKEKIYDGIKDLPTAFKTLGHQAKLVGRKGILLPTETSGQSEIDAFHEALGRPKTAEEYRIAIPEGQEEYYTDEYLNNGKKMFHGLGLNQKQVDVLVEYDQQRKAAEDKALDDFEAQELSDAETALRNKWGTAYDENLHLVNRMISENAQVGEERDYLLAEYGNDPKLAGFLGNIAKRFVEHKIITDVETPSSDLEGRKKELMASEAYKNASHPDHKSVADQVRGIFEQLAKMKTTG